MPIDDLYWNSIDFGSEDESVDEPMTQYVDPWDLENYAYIRQHLDSIDLSNPESSGESSGENSNNSSFYGVVQKEQNYAAIEEVEYGSRRLEGEKRGQNPRYYSHEFAENPYEVSTKEATHYGVYEERKSDWRHSKNQRPKGREYNGGGEIYSKLEEYPRKSHTNGQIYDDVRRQPRNFGLSNYGHLQIDYSYSWNNLNKYIYH